MDVGELMRKVRAGDRADLPHELYRRHAQRVFAYLWRDGGSVAAYLVQTTRNLALNAQRHQRVRRAVATFRWSAPE